MTTAATGEPSSAPLFLGSYEPGWHVSRSTNALWMVEVVPPNPGDDLRLSSRSDRIMRAPGQLISAGPRSDRRWR